MGRRRSNRAKQLTAKARIAYQKSKPRICPKCSNTLVVYRHGPRGFRVVDDVCQVSALYKGMPSEHDAIVLFIEERRQAMDSPGPTHDSRIRDYTIKQ
jgi:hypothetical protein